MSSELELAFLGNIEIRQNGSLVTGFNSGKSQALLCYLAVTGRPHLRPTLAGLLWGDLPEDSARNNLRKALTNLRQLVGVHLSISRQAAAFNRDNSYWLDVERFEAQVGGVSTQADIARLEEAVELYRGDFLEGFYVPQAPAFEEWMLARQARLRELALQALHHLAAFYVGQGEVGLMKGIDYTTRLLALDPWREEAHRQLMLLLAQSGQRSAALAQYETCRQTLVEELGVEPGQDTTALYERIRCGDVSREAEGQGRRGDDVFAPLPPRTPAPLHNLPAQTTPFIGRETELAELTQLLARPDLRLLTIVGPGGMGKTRLAQELAATHLDRFEHGVYFVRLGPLASAESIIPAIAEALNFSFYSGSSPEQQLHHYLREKQVLLLMDNYEHLLDGVNIVVELLKAAPGLKIVATSRARLNVREEQSYSISGIDFPDEVLAKDIEQFSAVKLFLKSARRIRSDFALTAGDVGSVGRICRLVQGMPLALILAATWVEVLSLAEIAEELGRSLDFLAGNLRDLPERQQSMRAVFDHSWRLLTEQEQEVFRQMSVFRGGFTREAAEMVTGATLLTLRALVNKSLLQHTPAGRYEIHELLRQYAVAQLDRAEKLDQTVAGGEAVRERHSAYYCAFVQAREADLKGARQQPALAEIEADHENIWLAWNWAAEQGQVERLAQAIDGLALFHDWRGRFQEGEIAYRLAAERLAAALSAEELLILTKLLTWQALFCRRLGQPERASRLFQESLLCLNSGRLADRDTRLEKAFVLLEMGKYLAYTDRQEAKRLLGQSLILYQALGDRWATARVLASLGSIAWHLSSYEEAKQRLQESLVIRQELGDQRGMAKTLNMLGRVIRHQGQLEACEQLQRESLVILQKLGDQDSLAQVRLDLGISLGWLGRFTEGVSLLEESLVIYSNLGHRSGLALANFHLGEVKLHLGWYEQARAHQRTALALFGETGDQRGIGFSLGGLGWIALIEEAYAEAQQLLQEGVAMLRRLRQQVALGYSLAILGGVACDTHNFQQAQQYLLEPVRIALETRAFFLAHVTLAYVALFLARRGQPERAVEIYALASRFPYVANSRWYEDVAGRHIAAAATTPPPEVVAAAQERGKARDLWATAKELLAELAQKK
jgi:predicted ATPase/DNA-binding SARP family transcriptional activator